MAQLQEIFESFQCKICMNEYNSTYLPRIVCTNDHIICTICAKTIPGYICPYCKQRMRYNDDYKQLFKIKEATQKVLDRQQKFQENISSLERMVEKLGAENQQLIKDKQKDRYYIESNQFCFKMEQIPQQHDSFEKKFAFLTDKVKEGMQILNQKAKKITHLKDQQSKTQEMIKELSKKLSIQQQISQRLYKDLQEMQGHMQFLERQVQSLTEQIQNIQQEREYLRQQLIKLYDQQDQSLEQMRRQREYYDQQLKMTKDIQNERVAQIMIKCQSLELKNKDHILQKQALSSQIHLLNRKIEKQRENYNSQNEYFMKEKQLGQQSLLRLKTSMQDIESKLKNQIETLRGSKIELIMQKQRMMAESKDKQDMLQSILRQNQSFKERVAQHEVTIAKLQDEKSCLSRQKEQKHEKYLAQLQLLKTNTVQLNKSLNERNNKKNQLVASKQKQPQQIAQVETLESKKVNMHGQTSSTIEYMAQNIISTFYNASNLRLGQKQSAEIKNYLSNQCEGIEYKIKDISTLLAIQNKKTALLAKENHDLLQNNQLLKQLSNRYELMSTLSDKNLQKLKRENEQQKQRHEQAIQKYQITQRQLQKKICQLEGSIQQKVNENNNLQAQLKADRRASSEIRQELINKELVLNEQIDKLTRQNQQLRKKLANFNLIIHQDSSQLDSSSKNKFSAINQPKLERQKALSSINSTNVYKIDQCNKLIQEISENGNDLKVNYEKCLDIITSINSIQYDNKRKKSFHKLSTTRKDKEVAYLCPSKFSKYISCDLSNQNQNYANLTHVQHSKQHIQSQYSTISRQRPQIKLPAKIFDSLHKPERSRRESKSHRSITSIIQTQKEAMKSKMIE